MLAGAALVATWACGTGQVASEAQARRVWLGLEPMVGKSIQLGFSGFNAASSANIPPQTTSGDDAGTLTVTGKVDQGSSANKGMRLKLGLVGYSDGPVAVDGGKPVELMWDTTTTVDAQPSLDLQLKDIPTGTWSGTLTGEFQMRGELTGGAGVALTFAGQLTSNDAGQVVRKPGSTTITGTVQSDAGVYQVNLTQ